MFFQTLESRELFAATATLDSSSKQLRVKGTGSNDVIEMWKDGSNLKVKLNGVTKTFVYANVQTVHTTMGSGDDKFKMNDNVVKAAYIAGESGKDTLIGGGQNDYLTGGDNNDTLDGGKGDDILVGNGGTDTADYSNRTYDLKITLDGNANDGIKNGGHDNVMTDVENVKCGSGNDSVTGSSKNNKIEGGAGKDTLTGQSGNDTLYGNSGNDNLVGNTGNDKVYGGSGNDWIDVSDGAYGDTVDGESGTDEVYYDKSGNSKDSVSNCEIKHA